MLRHLFPFFALWVLGGGCQPPAQTQEDNSVVQDLSPQPGPDQPTDAEIKIAFYNVENLFDTEDNPDKLDEDFLPEGRYQWTPEKYQKKLDNMARVLNGLQADVVGLAEVENRKVLEDLVRQELLLPYGYSIVHDESPDDRGIDVALIYRSDAFYYVGHQAKRVVFPGEPDYHSRDFLVVEGRVNGGEPLFLLVNHWPSRRDGPEVSEPRRIRVAERVKSVTDSIFASQKDACIVLMGDFNDDPGNRSISEVLNAQPSPDQVQDDGFYNPMAALHIPDSSGTLTYKGSWNLFDQFILSENLLQENNPITYQTQSAGIFHPEWMSIGQMKGPRRSIFRGEFDEEGFSDHFPITLVLNANPQ